MSKDVALLYTELQKMRRQRDELLEALEAALEWIDAIPNDFQLPAMPGFDRDWVDSIIAKAKGEG
jgi:hypothetical protein